MDIPPTRRRLTYKGCARVILSSLSLFLIKFLKRYLSCGFVELFQIVYIIIRQGQLLWVFPVELICMQRWTCELVIDFNSFSFPRDRTEKTSDKIEIESFQLHFVYMCFVCIDPSFRAK